ncbi:TetR/AcrR family transcriptional regulator [Paenibacillus allorhizosphaerae]|uniref:HTH-type transcriptional regulator BetI n=1 Tax=Paenibacillus allorhizosphaerae TaxID=2849866 RepID=A0ABN7TWF0_9BACL|nr:TetR/AcrR family transcriptional regulator [Paenibacillus allorhizosphaerae]CAG7654794.1 HTH-type transcriptional regulator BetI [Paenibacillus allorhizosphaerae]
MNPTSDSKRDASGDARREQIKRAALKVFARRGLDGTKMSMIAAEAGVSDGLAYRYFKSKDDIFEMLVREAIDGANEAFETIGRLSVSPLERFRALTKEIIEDENNDYFVLVQQVMSADSLPKEVAQLIEGYSTLRMIDQMAPVFADGQRDGVFIDGDPRELVMWYLTVLSGLMLVDRSLLKDYRPPQTDFLLNLIVKPRQEQGV